MTAPTDTTTPAGTVADLAADVITTAPEPTGKPPVSESVVTANGGKIASVEKTYAAPPPPAENLGTDSLGRAFDAAKFKPEKDSVGRWKNKNSGRKSAAPADNATPPPAAEQSRIDFNQPPPAAPASAPSAESEAPRMPAGKDRFDLLGDVYTQAGIGLAMSALGPDWKPEDKDEFGALRDSVAAYLRATNREDLSPGWALALAVTTYAGKRIPKEKTQMRLAGFTARLRAWWTGRSNARAIAAAAST